MPASPAKKKSPKKKTNRVDALKAIDKLPGRDAGQQSLGMAQPAPFPYPSSQLDRSASGVPNLTDMVLRSFQPAQAATPAGQPPQQADPNQEAAQTTNPRSAPPMSSRSQGAQPKRGFTHPGADGRQVVSDAGASRWRETNSSVAYPKGGSPFGGRGPFGR